MDVNTGEVLALVSLPLYDNNVFSGKVDEARYEQYLNDPKKPLVNHALAEQYPPGSIFKQITGAAALQEGVATTAHDDHQQRLHQRAEPVRPSIIYTFKDWRALGTLDFYGGVAMSSDVYFYYLAGGYHEYGSSFDGLGIDRLASTRAQFGLGPPDRHRHRRRGARASSPIRRGRKRRSARSGRSATPTTWASARASSPRRRSRWRASSPPSPTAARC